MSPKRCKKKKNRCKTALNLKNRKKLKSCKSSTSELFLNNNEKERFLQNSSPDKKIYSDFYFDNKYISKLKDFVQMRDHYFPYLKTVISENCAFSKNAEPSVTELEKLSLDLEQHALLASLQSDIYVKLITQIISDIEKCTLKKEIHQEIKKLLPNPNSLEDDNTIKCTKSSKNSLGNDIYSVIPTISSTRPELHDNVWIEESFYGSNMSDLYYPVLPQNSDNYFDNNDNSWNFHGTYDGPSYNTTYWCSEKTQIDQNDSSEICQDINMQTFGSLLSENISTSNSAVKMTDGLPPEPPDQDESFVSSLGPLNQVQKSAKQDMSNPQKPCDQKTEEKERAYIAQILEGEDSLDERFDSFSDNEIDSKGSDDELNLANRIKKMRELFGEDDKIGENKLNVPVKKTNKITCQMQDYVMWRQEKIIQQYKYALLASEMTFSRQMKNQELFLELFGDDSDEEHEAEYRVEEKYRTSCIERISSWVVKYLMPYYHKKRIVGRNVFKILGHHISDTIIDEIQYPDEWAVKYFVSKFFPSNKKYISDADVINFHIGQF